LNVSIGDRWEEFVEQLVKSGRYGSASEVVREGLRLVEERETRLKALQATLDATLPDEGFTKEEVDAARSAGGNMATTRPSKAMKPVRFKPRP